MIRAEMRISKTVNGWPIPVRYFWTQLWGYCDDHGRGHYDAQVIVADTFPIDSRVTARRIEEWMAVIERDGVIRRYEVGGKLYFECVNWEEHQPLRYRRKSKIPAPDGTFPKSSGRFGNFSHEGEGEVEEKKKGEGIPTPHCAKHPHGTDHPCRACGDARRAFEGWKAEQKHKPTSTPRRGDPKTCKHKKHPTENYCVLCDKVLT